MLLTIDIGNTNIVFGVFAGAALKHHFRLKSDPSRTHDEYSVLIRGLLHDVGVDMKELKAAVMASVVPPLTPILRRVCVEKLGKAPLVIEPGIKTGIAILYENPRDVGADRIVNAVAGYERYRDAPGGPHGLIIVDLGTATTFDVVSPRGEYLGGAIAPGVGIATEALFARAAKLPRVELAVPASAIGRTTVASMQSGILFGYVALVDGMVQRMMAEVDFVPQVLATGGIAPLIAPHSQCIAAVDDLLTLEGLRIIHGRNSHYGGSR